MGGQRDGGEQSDVQCLPLQGIDDYKKKGQSDMKQRGGVRGGGVGWTTGW